MTGPCCRLRRKTTGSLPEQKILSAVTGEQTNGDSALKWVENKQRARINSFAVSIILRGRKVRITKKPDVKRGKE